MFEQIDCGRSSRVTPDYTRLQDAFSSANRLSARATNLISANSCLTCCCFARPSASGPGGAMKHFLTGIVLIAGISGLVEPSVAKVVKFEVLRVESPAFEGRKFGTVGTYDRIIARATIAVSPSDAHNSIVVDIDRAPRNALGLVEAISDVEILRPTIPANANRRLLYEVLNRGTKLGPALFNDSIASTDPAKPTDDGNGFLLNHGFTLIWSGWQGDVPVGSGRLTFAPPTVPDVIGLSREEFIFDHMENPASAPL